VATASSGAGRQIAAESLAAKTKRPGALIPNIALWSVAFLIAVLIARALTANVGVMMGPYWSGLITLILFAGVGLYSVRKRYLWISLRMVRLATRIARPLANWLVMMDRLETWRAVHVTVGVIALLPFMWHMQAGMMSPLEATLLASVLLLFLSGFFGVFLQQYFPHAMTRRAEHEVRLKDVDARIRELYVQAEEKILGHKEELVKAYLDRIKPILLSSTPQSALMLATIRGVDPGEDACRPASEMQARLGTLSFPPSALIRLPGKSHGVTAISCSAKAMWLQPLQKFATPWKPTRDSAHRRFPCAGTWRRTSTAFWTRLYPRPRISTLLSSRN
jgi:hypothetical protein